MTSISSIEKDSIATTRDYFKDCILACKISKQMDVNVKKRKVSQAASSNFAQKWLLRKTISWTIVALLSVAYNIHT